MTPTTLSTHAWSHRQLAAACPPHLVSVTVKCNRRAPTYRTATGPFWRYVITVTSRRDNHLTLQNGGSTPMEFDRLDDAGHIARTNNTMTLPRDLWLDASDGGMRQARDMTMAAGTGCDWHTQLLPRLDAEARDVKLLFKAPAHSACSLSRSQAGPCTMCHPAHAAGVRPRASHVAAKPVHAPRITQTAGWRCVECVEAGYPGQAA